VIRNTGKSANRSPKEKIRIDSCPNRVLLQVQHRSTTVLLSFLASAGCTAPGSKFDMGALPCSRLFVEKPFRPSGGRMSMRPMAENSSHPLRGWLLTQVYFYEGHKVFRFNISNQSPNKVFTTDLRYMISIICTHTRPQKDVQRDGYQNRMYRPATAGSQPAAAIFQ